MEVDLSIESFGCSPDQNKFLDLSSLSACKKCWSRKLVISRDKLYCETLDSCGLMKAKGSNIRR